MQTELIKITEQNSEKVLNKATTIIKNGGLVVFPTETVYGLGANVFDDKAIAKIFVAKGRPGDNPLIVHVSEKSQLKELTDEVTENQKKMIDVFWPGPLTIIFKKKRLFQVWFLVDFLLLPCVCHQIFSHTSSFVK